MDIHRWFYKACVTFLHLCRSWKFSCTHTTKKGNLFDDWRFFCVCVCVFMCFSLIDFDWIGKKPPLQKLLGKQEKGGVLIEFREEEEKEE